jgi:hypothetical protein
MAMGHPQTVEGARVKVPHQSHRFFPGKQVGAVSGRNNVYPGVFAKQTGDRSAMIMMNVGHHQIANATSVDAKGIQA